MSVAHKRNRSGRIICCWPGCRKHRGIALLGGQYYCHRHKSSWYLPEYCRLPEKYMLSNREGVQLCHFIGCRSTHISKSHGGLFCDHHDRLIATERQSVTHTQPPSEDELRVRLWEMNSRKIKDYPHVHYARQWIDDEVVSTNII